jgi:hypothetical protein
MDSAMTRHVGGGMQTSFCEQQSNSIDAGKITVICDMAGIAKERAWHVYEYSGGSSSDE